MSSWDGSHEPDLPWLQAPEDNDPQRSRWFTKAVVSACAIGGIFAAAGTMVGRTMPVKQEVQVNRTVVTKHVEAPPPAPPVEPDSCLNGMTGTVVHIGKSEQYSDNQYYTLVTFIDPEDRDLTVTCKFSERVDQVWTTGMKIRTGGGERIIGHYKGF